MEQMHDYVDVHVFSLCYSFNSLVELKLVRIYRLGVIKKIKYKKGKYVYISFCFQDFLNKQSMASSQNGPSSVAAPTLGHEPTLSIHQPPSKPFRGPVTEETGMVRGPDSSPLVSYLNPQRLRAPGGLCCE